ncbi:MAG: hypothetical protein QOD99_27, partial [Chthoniobacter sp.]|nr:hypothetical protein [Chthoniobacter sp.]
MKLLTLITTVLLGINALLAAAEPIPASSVNWLGAMGS